MIMGSFVPAIYYGFYCDFYAKLGYTVSMLVLGTISIIVSLWDKFATPAFRPIRAGLFCFLFFTWDLYIDFFSFSISFNCFFRKILYLELRFFKDSLLIWSNCLLIFLESTNKLKNLFPGEALRWVEGVCPISNALKSLNLNKPG